MVFHFKQQVTCSKLSLSIFLSMNYINSSLSEHYLIDSKEFSKESKKIEIIPLLPSIKRISRR